MTDPIKTDPIKTALSKFHEGVQLCDHQEDVSRFCQLMCALSTKMISGIEGEKFKRDFLTAAIADKSIIKIQKARIQ